MTSEAILFYDARCGACRVFVRLILAADTARRLRTAPLDSSEADRHLGPLTEQTRYGSFHLAVNGRVVSGGQAVGPLLELLPALRPLGRLLGRSAGARRAAEALYDALARNRGRLRRFLPRVGPPPR